MGICEGGERGRTELAPLSREEPGSGLAIQHFAARGELAQPVPFSFSKRTSHESCLAAWQEHGLSGPSHKRDQTDQHLAETAFTINDPPHSEPRFEHEVERRLGRAPEDAKAGLLKHRPQSCFPGLRPERHPPLLGQRMRAADGG